MCPTADMGAAVQLVEIGVCIVGIGHQHSFEVAKELLNAFPLPASEQVIADLRRQVNDDPHVPLDSPEGAVWFTIVLNLYGGFRFLLYHTIHDPTCGKFLLVPLLKGAVRYIIGFKELDY